MEGYHRTVFVSPKHDSYCFLHQLIISESGHAVTRHRLEGCQEQWQVQQLKKENARCSLAELAHGSLEDLEYVRSACHFGLDLAGHLWSPDISRCLSTPLIKNDVVSIRERNITN